MNYHPPPPPCQSSDKSIRYSYFIDYLSTRSEVELVKGQWFHPLINGWEAGFSWVEDVNRAQLCAEW